jgi:hypothetical protein
MDRNIGYLVTDLELDKAPVSAEALVAKFQKSKQNIKTRIIV